MEELIAQLAGDAEPVRPLAPVRVRLAQWALVGIGSAALVALALGVRSDIAAALRAAPFVLALLVSVVISMASAWITLTLSVPGAVTPAWMRQLPLLLTVVLGGWWLSAARASGQSVLSEPWHAACWARAVAFGTLPLAGLFVAARRGLVLDTARATAMAALAAAALAAAAVQWTCPIDRAAHLFVSHWAPMVAFAAIVALSARGAITAPARS